MSGAAVASQEGKVCAAFRDGRVEPSILTTMLNAAERGRLYRVEADTSRVGFCVDSALQRIEGTFSEFQGGMVLGQPGRQGGQALMAVRSASLRTNHRLVGNLMKGRGFFDVENYPDILFVSKGFEWIDDTTALMKGDLSLHGVTRPVTFVVRLLPDDGGVSRDEILVKATTTLNRSDFGMGALSPLISDTVQLCLTVRAQKYSAGEA